MIGVIGIIAFFLILWYWFYKQELKQKRSIGLPDEEYQNQHAASQYEVNSLREEIGSLQLLLTSKSKELDETGRKLQEAEDKVLKQEEMGQKILSMKKSSEIRLGNAAEQLAPFLDGFNHDPKHLRFLGSPIDYISFDRDCVTFIEIKSGNSHLSHNQKNIKRLIKEGRVKWQEFRINGKTIHKRI
jgi:predicted Holliday junction resolvase-like endonuclease